jgi:putative tricarboxylic transport membrane protein
VVLGVLVLVATLDIDTDFAQRGPVGPNAVPIVIGSLLRVVGLLLA